MQAAYHEYKNSSATLEALASSVPREIRSRDPDLQLEMAAEQQRVTFENYIEARLQFSEFLLSGENGEFASVGISNDSERWTGPGQPDSTGFWNGFTTSRAVVAAFAPNSLQFDLSGKRAEACSRSGSSSSCDDGDAESGQQAEPVACLETPCFECDSGGRDSARAGGAGSP
jgi:hypothetical protein